jgi:hypothetical protein
MARQAIRLGVTALVSTAALVVGGGTAGASSPASGGQSLTTIQARAAAAISRRVADLDTAITKVNSAKHLGPASGQLVTYLQTDITPLQQLGQTIAADPTVATAAADASRIFTEYRVLALVIPSARVAGASASIVYGAVPRLTTDASKATARIDPANAATVQPLVDDLNAQIASATASTSGVVTRVLGYTPAQWNDDHGLLSASRADVRSAKAAVAQARVDVRELRADLKT